MPTNNGYRFHISVRIQSFKLGEEGSEIYQWNEIKKALDNSILQRENFNVYNDGDPIHAYFQKIANESIEKFLRDIEFLYGDHYPRIEKIRISELRYGHGSLIIDFFYSVIATGITYAAIKGAVHEFKIDIKSLLSKVTNGYVDVCVRKKKFKFTIGRSRYRQFKIKKSYISGAVVIILFAISMWFNSYSSSKSEEEMRLLIKEVLQARQLESEKEPIVKTDTIP